MKYVVSVYLLRDLIHFKDNKTKKKETGYKWQGKEAEVN